MRSPEVSVPTPEKPPPFPRTFYAANSIELFERLAFYGMYVGLSLYLTNVVGFSDIGCGVLLSYFRLVTTLAPIACGALADRIGFKRSLVIAFTLYALGYLGIFVAPTRGLVAAALLFIGFAGGFMKPVITGTVIRTSPKGRQTDGFAIFYRMVNAGSVVGKSLAYGVRRLLALRYVTITSVAASLVALALSIFVYRDPEPEEGAPAPPPLRTTLRGFRTALANPRFVGFLLATAGFYFLGEQFYFTFPKYVTRHIDPKAPLEFITLINPALIALLQGTVLRFSKRLHPLTAMAGGMGLGVCSMLVMGSVSSMWGACLSAAIFALAEMMFSPPFYDAVASFAPKGKEGMYMGLAFMPMAVGAWVGGQTSGVLIARYLPASGPREPFTVWATYAACGAACVFGMLTYRWVILRRSVERA